MNAVPSPRLRVRANGYDLAEDAVACGVSTYALRADDADGVLARIVFVRHAGRLDVTVEPATRTSISAGALAAPLARAVRARRGRDVVRIALLDARGCVVAAGTDASPRGIARLLARRSGRAPTRADAASAAARSGVPESYGRDRALGPSREPPQLAFAGHDRYGREQWLEPRAAAAWRRMRGAAARDGVALELVSAFRSIPYQAGLVERKRAKGQSIDEILRVSAAPGYSEHHTGRAIDVSTPGFPVLEEAFEDSPAFAWLTANAARFGFRMSYPRGNPHGIAYEPWHWCHAAR
jgi:D-alanyl-D-alanine carboxypeptidase